MAVKTIAGAFLALTGTVSLFLGIMFIIASGEGSSRMTAGTVFVVVAVLCLVAGIFFIRKGQEGSPTVVRNKILTLARRNQGVVREEVIIAAVGDNDMTRNTIHFFIVNKLAERFTNNGMITYRFPDFHLKLVVKKCPYCGNDYSVRSNLERCPGCGSDLKMETARVDKEQDLFNMDE